MQAMRRTPGGTPCSSSPSYPVGVAPGQTIRRLSCSFLLPGSVPLRWSREIVTGPSCASPQSAALALPNVGQAITIDIGEADDIHPRNKQDVGLRLALAARHLAYGEDLVYSGPLYRDHVVEGDRVILSFDHTGSGLVARGSSQPGGFAIAGADGRFVWADARIDGNTVVVSSTSVTNPVAVRYAWADNPDRANLYNVEGLPAAPFRTDP